MSESGLGSFGIRPSTALRVPTTDEQDVRICPECGSPVGRSKGTQRIDHPNVAEEGLTGFEELFTLGWRCTRHPRDVVMPVEAGGPDATAMPAGWTGVAVQFTDGVVRYVAVPEKEVKGRGE